MFTMKREKSQLTITVIFIIVLAALALPRPAYAYLDPGTGSFIAQVIIAGLISVGFFMKTFWVNMKKMAKKLKTIFGSKDETEKQE